MTPTESTALPARILMLLKEHPLGLTSQGIAERLDVERRRVQQTISAQLARGALMRRGNAEKTGKVGRPSALIGLPRA